MANQSYGNTNFVDHSIYPYSPCLKS
jgi:hypothetical protein